MKAVPRTKLAQVAVALLERYSAKQVAAGLANLLRQQRRLGEVEYLLIDIARQLFIQKKHLAGQLTSAQTVSTSLLKTVQAFLKQRSGATDVELTQQQDPILIGGLIARTPLFEVDWSIKHRLNQLRTK